MNQENKSKTSNRRKNENKNAILNAFSKQYVQRKEIL